MAIAFDNAIASNYQASGTLGASFTMGGGTNGVLYVWNESGGGGDPSGITFNGVAMTQVISNATSVGISLWVLPAPASGSHTISVTSSGQIFFCATSYTGASQSPSVDNSGSATGHSTSAAVSLTPVASNCWMMSYLQDDGTASITATGTDVLRTSTGPFGDMMIVDTNTTISSGSHTQTLTVDSSDWAMASITIAPFVAAGTQKAGFFRFL